mmetsp:Transcript_5627/g.16553  ORF Transcript_5627/g.16553 Transcript_5627/m.16553 type:complete len:205 (+) Transcript_5627:585-1199(+)
MLRDFTPTSRSVGRSIGLKCDIQSDRSSCVSQKPGWLRKKSRISSATSNTSVCRNISVPGSVCRAIMSTKAGWTMRRFRCRFLNIGSGNCTAMRCTELWRRMSPKMRSRSTFTFDARKPTFFAPERSRWRFAMSTAGPRSSSPSTFKAPASRSPRAMQKRPLAQPRSMWKGSVGSSNWSSTQVSDSSIGCWRKEERGFACCRRL